MNNELAESFFRDIYATHVPDIGGDCSGEHEVSGFEAEQPSYPCELYKKAAEILGLPIVKRVRPRLKPRTPEEEARREAFLRIYGPLVEYALKPSLLYERLSQNSEGESVTFRIQN